MQTCIRAVVLVMLGLAAPCYAEPPASELLRQCTFALRIADHGITPNTPINEVADAAFCSGYLVGFGEGFPVAEEPPTVCLPDPVSREQLIRVAVKYMRDNPEFLHLARGVVTILALQKAFPCKGTGASSPPPTPKKLRPPTTFQPSKGRY